MRKIFTIFIIGVLLVAFSAAVFAQEKKEAKADDTKKKWANTVWKKVDKLTKEKRSFKTERITTVAGVRGDEAEDEIEKNLYYKGGTQYPTRLELKNAIDILIKSVKAEPDAESVPESKYFIAQCYTELGDLDKAIRYYNEIVDDHKDSKYSVDAKTEMLKLQKMKDQQEKK